MRTYRVGLALAAIASVLAVPRRPASPAMASLFGELKYGPDFKHFDYVNPNAPKGGTMRWPAIGTYDTLNPFVVKGCRRPISARSSTR